MSYLRKEPLEVVPHATGEIGAEFLQVRAGHVPLRGGVEVPLPTVTVVAYWKTMVCRGGVSQRGFRSHVALEVGHVVELKATAQCGEGAVGLVHEFFVTNDRGSPLSEAVDGSNHATRRSNEIVHAIGPPQTSPVASSVCMKDR